MTHAEVARGVFGAVTHALDVPAYRVCQWPSYGHATLAESTRKVDAAVRFAATARTLEP